MVGCLVGWIEVWIGIWIGKAEDCVKVVEVEG